MTEETKQKIRQYYKNEPPEKKAERIQKIKDYHAQIRANEQLKAQRLEQKNDLRKAIALLATIYKERYGNLTIRWPTIYN